MSKNNKRTWCSEKINYTPYKGPAILGTGVVKSPAFEIKTYVDRTTGHVWTCDREAFDKIDRTKPMAEQSIPGCEIMPFDYGG